MGEAEEAMRRIEREAKAMAMAMAMAVIGYQINGC